MVIMATPPKKIFLDTFCKKYISRGNFMRGMKHKTTPLSLKASGPSAFVIGLKGNTSLKKIRS
jgi:hypothetical protein